MVQTSEIKFRHVPGVAVNESGCVGFKLHHDKFVHPYQSPAYINVHDFLQVAWGKATRSADLSIEHKKIVALLGKKKYVFIFD